MSDTNEFGTPYDQNTFPMTETEKKPERENKFAPCPHDPAGARKDECVQCYPPERYLGLSGNLLITEKKPEMTAVATLQAEWLAQGKYLAWSHWLSHSLLEAREATTHLQAELRDAKQLLLAEIEKTSRLERELVEAQLERDKSRRALERIRICNTVAATIAIAEARIRELEWK